MWLFSPFGLTIIGMLIGLAGTLLPVLPGLIIIVACASLYYTFVAGWTASAVAVIVVMAALFLGSIAVEYLLAPVGARQAGASWWASILAGLAGIIGFFILPFIGALLLPLAVVLIVEYLIVRDLQHAGRATRAYLIGWLVSSGLKFLAGLLMIAAFWLQAGR